MQCLAPGNNEESAVELMRKILSDYSNSLSGLGKASVDELCRYKGIGSINVQEIELPEDMKRAMAKQAEAERNRRAMVIAAQGEVESAQKMLEAAKTLEQSSVTIQLKTLQTIKDISFPHHE